MGVKKSVVDTSTLSREFDKRAIETSGESSDRMSELFGKALIRNWANWSCFTLHPHPLRSEKLVKMKLGGSPTLIRMSAYILWGRAPLDDMHLSNEASIQSNYVQTSGQGRDPLNPAIIRLTFEKDTVKNPIRAIRSRLFYTLLITGEGNLRNQTRYFASRLTYQRVRSYSQFLQCGKKVKHKERT